MAELGDVLDETVRLGAQAAQIYAPEGRTHKLKRHISSQHATRDAAGGLEARVGIERMSDERDPKRGIYPDVGTGVYGEGRGAAGTYIRPSTGRFMVFEIDGRLIVTPRVKGQVAQHFMRDAYRDMTEYLPARLELMVRRLESRLQ